MELKKIRKINEGDSGSVAATTIYNNERTLYDGIKAVKDELDAYGALINIPVSGQTHAIVQGPGSGPMSTRDVMSQSAVTYYVEEMVEDQCKIGPEIIGTIEMPSTSNYVNVWVSRASANAQGNSLTTMYNDIQDLKRLNDAIADLQTQINNLSDRVARLEAKNDGY